MANRIDPTTGALELDGGDCLAGDLTFDSLQSMAAGNESTLEHDDPKVVALSSVTIDGAPATVVISFNYDGALAEIMVRLRASTDEAHPLQLDLEHKAWLAAQLGPAPHAGPRGVMYAFDWGWVYAVRGAIFLTRRGHHVALPPPWESAAARCEFRCLMCGEVSKLPYGYGVIRARRERGAVPCAACGSVAWVQVGSMTEFYVWSKRPNVCEVGKHAADDVATYELVPDGKPSVGGLPKPGKLAIKCCGEHLPILEQGFLGCVLKKRG
ncbi:MAG: hypothetical protein HY898_09115 [Deltaproteobacteria bacterium]|nr:hypothetical protein [Deltaproteobacteria bacterium]